MSALIVTLPIDLDGVTPEYDFVLSADGSHAAAHGRCPASLLPAPAKPAAEEVVAVVPARALSWHQVKLPQAIAGSLVRRKADPQRLRAVLAGILEDQLLDEPDQLHFAVFPGAEAGAPAWVAVCDRAWLHAVLQELEAAGRGATRIVPEFAPLTAPVIPTGHVAAGLDPAQLVMRTSRGVSVLPLCPVSVRLAQEAGETELLTEPAVAETAEQAFQRKGTIQTDVQRRLLAAADASWNLAQFDLAPSRQTRLLKKLSQAWLAVSRSAAWRPVRWSLIALLIAHVLGLNIVAWKQHAELDNIRSASRNLLVQTFPHVTLVVDAPLQMERELVALQQATGESGNRGLANVLMQLSLLAPQYQPLDALALADGELSLQGPPLGIEELDALASRLSALGWPARRQDQRLVIALKTSP